MQINLYANQLEPGTHICRKIVSQRLIGTVEVPDDECKEIRPDWGVYLPVITFPAIERSLRAHHLAPACDWSFSIA